MIENTIIKSTAKGIPVVVGASSWAVLAPIRERLLKAGMAARPLSRAAHPQTGAEVVFCTVARGGDNALCFPGLVLMTPECDEVCDAATLHDWRAVASSRVQRLQKGEPI